MGYIGPEDILEGFAALEKALQELKVNIQTGQGVDAVREVLESSKSQLCCNDPLTPDRAQHGDGAAHGDRAQHGDRPQPKVAR